MTTRWTVFAQTISLLAARGGVSLGAVLLLGLGVAWGQPTLTATESIDSTTGDLTVSFKETGLGTTPVSYELTAGTVDFYYQCFNANGIPSNPVTSSNLDVSSDVTLTPRKYTITGSLSLSDETVLLLCQQKGLKLCSVGSTYSDVTIADTTTMPSVTPVSLPTISIGSPTSSTPLQCFNTTNTCLQSGDHCGQYGVNTKCCSGFCTGSPYGNHNTCS
jgi:hypothetical protein